MWYLLDIIIAAVFIGFIIYGARRGFIKAVCGMLVTVAAIWIAFTFSGPLAEFFRGTVVYQSLTDRLNERVTAYVTDPGDEGKLRTLFDDSPREITGLLEGFGVSSEKVAEKYDEILAEGKENAAKGITDYIVAPAAQKLSEALAVAVLFLVSLVLLHVAVWLLSLLFKLPLLNFANRLGGVIAGAVMGLLVSILFCTAVGIAMPYLRGAGIDLDAESAKHAVLYTAVDNINPLSFLYRK